MTSILKHDEIASVHAVRALDWGTLAGEAGDDLISPAILPELEEARAEAARLAADLADREANEPKRIAAARAEGRKEAETAHKQDDEAKLGALEAGLEAAIEAARPAFANVERLALLLAEQALTNAFDHTDDYRDQIGRAIRRQTAEIDARTILRLEVSRADFTDEHALSGLTNLSEGNVEILASDALAQGQARLCLTLGEIEIDLPRYWTELKAAFSDLARGPGA